MKASKKVMESVIVSGLALTLAVTAVTGNGVNIAAKDAADTQFVNNGIAGVASAMNEYELEYSSGDKELLALANVPYYKPFNNK